MRERGGEGSGEEEIREMQERGSVGDRCGEEEGAGSRERGAGRMWCAKERRKRCVEEMLSDSSQCREAGFGIGREAAVLRRMPFNIGVNFQYQFLNHPNIWYSVLSMLIPNSGLQ
jgi:hypothetical protein